MLVKREIIIMGDDLKSIIEEVRTTALRQGYQVRDVFSGIQNEHFALRLEKGDQFFHFDHEQDSKQLRVWPGFPGGNDEKLAWNTLIKHFHDTVLVPVCKSRSALTLQLTDDQRDIDFFFTPELVTLLREITSSPNTTSYHQTRWVKFLVKAAIESGERYSFELGDWLADQYVPKDQIEKMLDDYQTANWLIDEYFKQFPQHRPQTQQGPD